MPNPLICDDLLSLSDAVVVLEIASNFRKIPLVAGLRSFFRRLRGLIIRGSAASPLSVFSLGVSDAIGISAVAGVVEFSLSRVLSAAGAECW